MADQVHIRNVGAAQLARSLARQTGKPISDVVLEALRQYRPGGPEPEAAARAADWRRILREDREGGVMHPQTPIDAFYDPATGLPT